MPRWSLPEGAAAARRGATALDRRALLATLLVGATAGCGLATARGAIAAGQTVRMSASRPGTAGSVWDGLLDRFPELTSSLDIEWVGGDPGQFQVLLLTGAIDCGPYGALGVAEVARRGVDLVMFGPRLNNHGSWMVRGDSPFRTPRDLKGRRVATQVPTSETYRHARMAAALHGLDLRRDFEVIHGPVTANVALFERGDVDGVIIIEPTATRLVARGAREIARVSDMWQEATGDGAPLFLVAVAGLREWVEVNRETAARLALLSRRINQLIAAEPGIFTEPAVYEAMGFRADETDAIALLPERMPRVYPARWDREVFAGLERQLDVALDLGIIPEKPARPVYAALDV